MSETLRCTECGYKLEGYAPQETVCGACCQEMGECDICSQSYDVSDRSDHCADCGTCVNHCKNNHGKDNI